MKPTIPIGRRDTILDLANKRTQTICTLMDNSHVNDFDEILRLVDRPVGTHEEIRNTTESRHLEQISAWYDLIVRACRWLKDLNLTMTDHVYFFSMEHGVCVLPMAEIISHNSGYAGEKFTVRVADLLSDVLQPLLGTAISDGDVPAIRFLTDAVCYVIDELIPQEQPNG
jgi:hypothetical protein